MSKIWIIVLCVVLNSIPVIPTPKVPVAKWPSLIKSPTVPRLEDLKLAIRDLATKPRTVPDFSELITTNTDKNEDRNDCDKNEVELDAEEFKSLNNDTNYKNETISREKEKDIKPKIKNRHVNKKQPENNNETDNIKPLPTFIPIFRKRKPKRAKTPVKFKDENSSAKVQNIKHDNDLVVNYVKNGDDAPILNIHRSQDALDKGIIRVIPINTMFANGFPSSVITSHSQLANDAPINIGPLNVEPPSDGLTNIVPSGDVPTNAVQGNVLPIGTVLQNDVPANSAPTTSTKTRNAVIFNTIAPNPEHANGAPANAVNNINIIPNNVMDVKYPCPENDISVKLFPRNNIDMDTFMINTEFPNNVVPDNTIPMNISPIQFLLDNNIPVNKGNVVFIKMIPANTVPANINPKDTVPDDKILKKSLPVNTAPENVYHIITIPANAVPRNTEPANIAHEHTFAINTANPTNTIPAKSIIIKTASTANTVPSNTVPVNIDPTDKFSTILANGIMNAVPRNTDPANTYPSRNTIALSNTNPSNILPIKTGCNECRKCPDEQKADLVLFKPEEVSMLNVCGDILKKVTMTVLVPMYVSKLDF